MNTILRNSSAFHMAEALSERCLRRLDRVRLLPQARVVIPGVLETVSAPLTVPATGEEQRAILRMPDGMEYKEMEVAQSVVLKGTVASSLTTGTPTAPWRKLSTPRRGSSPDGSQMELWTSDERNIGASRPDGMMQNY